jgi:D-alanine transaminase
MSRIAYVNGRYVPLAEAAVHIEDRGYQFADGVYEVIAFLDHRFIDADPHLDRLDYSLKALNIAPPMRRQSLKMVLREMVRRNFLRHGSVYMQVTRGVAKRVHSYPDYMDSSLVMTVSPQINSPADDNPDGVSVITVRDNRWKRPDIKSISLLPNIMARKLASQADAYEAWQINDQGYVTEGSATNAWIVTSKCEVQTHPITQSILSGVTRQRIITLINDARLLLKEEPFTVEEGKKAPEAFLSAATSYIKPIISIDNTLVGDGKIGPITHDIIRLYGAFCRGQT